MESEAPPLAGDARAQVATVLQALAVPVLAFLVGQALVVGAFLALSTVGPLRGITDTSAIPLGWRVVLTALNFVGFGLGAALFVRRYDLRDLVGVRLPTRGDWAWTVGGLVGLLVAQYAIGVALSVLGIESAQNRVIEIGQRNPNYFLYMIPVTVVLVGPIEEFVFRGGVQGLLKRAFRTPTAVVLASFVFGVGHWFALTGGGSRTVYILVAAGLGLVLGALYERTGNLAVPAVAHGLYNTAVFLVQYGIATGAIPSGAGG